MPRSALVGSRAGSMAVAVLVAAITGMALTVRAIPSQAHFEAEALQRVNVALGVMSKCPDALYFETAFDRTLDRVNGKVSLDLTYIAHPNRSAPYGATCMHGDKECEGNVQQLCVIDALDPAKAGERFDISPSQAQRLWWNFVQCENYRGGRDKIGNENLAKDCLKAVTNKVDWKDDEIEDCVRGKRGVELLRKSIDETERRDISKSATLQIEGETVCIRDGGQWKECKEGHEPGDWVRQIEAAYEAKNRGRRAAPVSEAPHLLQKRQAPSSTTSNPSSTASSSSSASDSASAQPPPPPPPSGGQQGNTQQSAPLSVFTFIIAIALFVLVVSFVLLRIFVRNRRLRRMGIYPDGPIDRLLGGNIREFEDTLPVPKLWQANIADVRAGSSGASMRGEKATLGGALGASDVKHHGWDALMPVSAAFPPSLYPVIYANDGKQVAPTTNIPVTSQPRPEAGENRRPLLTRHMPHFLRRNADAAPGDVESAVTQTGNEATTASAPTQEGAGLGQSHDEGTKDERLASASVNVTVLIAMPSTRTVFPSARRPMPNTPSLASPRSNGNFRAGTANQQLGQSRLDGVQEDTGDADHEKGKMRRAPSLKSMKSTTSVKSLAEARREAFFSQLNDEQGKKQHDHDETNTGADERAGGEEEEEELPELVFGTASVPLFARLGTYGSNNELLPPATSDITELVNWSREVRQRRLAAEEARKKAEDAGEDNATFDNGFNAGPRVSNAETSIDGPSAAILSSSEGGFYGGTTSRAPTGDVVQRMLSTNSYEMNDMSRPSNAGPSESFMSDSPAYTYDVATPTTTAPLVEGRQASAANTPIQRPRDLPPIDTSSAQANTQTTHSVMTASPSVNTARSHLDDSRRHSTSTWHTGHDDEESQHDAQAQVNRYHEPLTM